MEVNDSPAANPTLAVAGSTPSLDLTDPNAGHAAAGSVASLSGGAAIGGAAPHSVAPQASPFHDPIDGADAAADLLFGDSAGLKYTAAGGADNKGQSSKVESSGGGGAAIRDVKLDAGAAGNVFAADSKSAALVSASANATATATATAAAHSASHQFLGHGKRRFEVSVSDPEKKGENYLSQHMTYKINTTKETAPGKFSQSSVVRRYNDFVWLHSQLTAKYKGFLIPPVPDKQLIGNLEIAFIQERKRALENFLTRIACHPDLSASSDVDVMLHGDDETLAKVKAGLIVTGAKAGQPPSPNEVANAKKSTAAGVWSIFKDVAQTVSNSVVGVKPREQTKDDIECDRVKTYAEALEKQLTGVESTATSLIDKSKAIAESWFAFGLACSHCAEYETNTGKEKELGTAFAKLGSAADKLSVLLSSKKDAETIHALELFRDYMRVVKSVQSMIAVRNKALAQYHQSLTTLEHLQAECGRLQANAAKKAQAAEKEKQVTAQQQTVDSEAADLKHITSTALAEAQRFRIEKLRDLKHVIVDFVKTQIEHAKKVQTAWEAVLTDITGPDSTVDAGAGAAIASAANAAAPQL